MARKLIVPVPEVAYWAHEANFVGLDLVTIVAICGAESGYNQYANALTSREDSRGLAQINVRAHPWGRTINLYDPGVNLAAAWRVYKEARFRFTPWTTYTNGHYRRYWAKALAAVQQLPPGAQPPPTVVWIRPPTDVPDDYSSHVTSMSDQFASLAADLNNWSRYIYNLIH